MHNSAPNVSGVRTIENIHHSEKTGAIFRRLARSMDKAFKTSHSRGCVSDDKRQTCSAHSNRVYSMAWITSVGRQRGDAEVPHHSPVHRDPFTSSSRPIHQFVETHSPVPRDPFTSSSRPIHQFLETHSPVRRDPFTSSSRPILHHDFDMCTTNTPRAGSCAEVTNVTRLGTGSR